MKRVIRAGIFETNSSSTHSFTIKKGKVKEDIYTTILKSPAEKIIWILGLIDNASSEYDNMKNIMISNIENKYREKIIEEILTSDSKTIEKIENKYGKIKEVSASTLIDIAKEYFDYECISNHINFYCNNSNFIDESRCKDIVLKYKEQVLETYSEILELTKEETLDCIYHSVYRDQELYDILTCSDNPQEEIEKQYLNNPYDTTFLEAYNKSEEKDLIKFAWLYMEDMINKKIKICRGKISCCLFFLDGSLRECNCGFENFYNIYNKLGLEGLKTNKDFKKHTIDFLKGESVIVARET